MGGACCSSFDTTATGSGSTQNQLVMMSGCCQQLSLAMIFLPCASWLFCTSPFQLCPVLWSIFLNHSETVTELSFVTISMISDCLCSYTLSLLSAGFPCLCSNPVAQGILVSCLVPVLAPQRLSWFALDTMVVSIIILIK